MELLKVDTLETAREKLLAAVGENWIKTKNVPLNEALNGVLAEDVYGKIHIPDFRRSMVDGYAVIAKDTMGAGESLPWRNHSRLPPGLRRLWGQSTFEGGSLRWLDCCLKSGATLFGSRTWI